MAPAAAAMAGAAASRVLGQPDEVRVGVQGPHDATSRTAAPAATPAAAGQTCQAGQCQCSAGLLACDGSLRRRRTRATAAAARRRARAAQVCSEQLLPDELRRRRDRRARAAPASNADEQRAQLRRVRQRVSRGLGVQRRRLRLLGRGPDVVRQRVRRHDEQQRPLRRLQPGLQRHVHERRVRPHAGRHGAAAAQHPPHDQRRVRRLRAGAARHHEDAEHELPARLAPARPASR